MKLTEIYPDMSDAQRALIINSLLASFEYILEVGEDEVYKELIESKIDCSAFKRVTQRIARYKQQH